VVDMKIISCQCMLLFSGTEFSKTIRELIT
jgi:hypothetical protein